MEDSMLCMHDELHAGVGQIVLHDGKLCTHDDILCMHDGKLCLGDDILDP